MLGVGGEQGFMKLTIPNPSQNQPKNLQDNLEDPWIWTAKFLTQNCIFYKDEHFSLGWSGWFACFCWPFVCFVLQVWSSIGSAKHKKKVFSTSGWIYHKFLKIKWASWGKKPKAWSCSSCSSNYRSWGCFSHSGETETSSTLKYLFQLSLWIMNYFIVFHQTFI